MKKNPQSISCVALLIETLAFKAVTFNVLASIIKKRNQPNYDLTCWALEFHLEGS